MHVPIKTVSGLNAREFWAKRAARVKRERAAVRLAWHQLGAPELLAPASVVLRRVAPRRLDRWDNLTSSFKGVIDELCAIAGVDDRRDDLIKFSFEQTKPRQPKNAWVEVEWSAL